MLEHGERPSYIGGAFDRTPAARHGRFLPRTRMTSYLPTGCRSLSRSLMLGALLSMALPGPGEELPPGAELPLAPFEQHAPALPEIAIIAPEPRYVAPTRRDRIGRIWAPVMIDGKGPYRLVLDTGASRSAVNAEVAGELGIPLNASPQLMLQGVTGRLAVPSIRAGSLIVGDLTLSPVTLPIVTDALGGAEGVLGTEGLGDKRIYIDFMHDAISITHSRRQRAPEGFLTIPMRRSRLGLLEVDASVGGIPVRGIIDTGGQGTVGNSAMLKALLRRQRGEGMSEKIEGVTTDIQIGEAFNMPPIQIGTLRIEGARAVYGDMRIFDAWKLTDQPVLLIGMDTIGLLDTLIIDYRMRELQVRMRGRRD
jgi:predicted aspartyl protease